MFDWILKYIYPDRCVICGGLVSFGKKGCLCGACKIDLKQNLRKRCKVCGRLLTNRDSLNNVCRGCVKGENYFSAGLAVFPFTRVRKSVHNLKYNGGRINVKPYAEIMYDYMNESGNFNESDFDTVTFVPMYADKERKRGYNQSKLIAERFGALCKRPCENLLVKTIYTKPQSSLSGAERRLNLKGAFKPVDIDRIRGKRILIIDDVLTTGATINECAKVLMGNGAERVMFVTFAFSD